MKYKFFILGLVLFCGLMATSCKNELQQTAGEYSYKISGSALIDSVETHLLNETGSLRIIDQNDHLLLSFNMLGGDIYSTTAKMEKKELELAPFERIITHELRDFKVSVTGSGNVYDNNILLHLNYKGISMDKDSIDFESTDMQLAAVRN